MTEIEGQHSDSSLAEVMGHIKKKGVILWSRDGQLYYKAPRGALTSNEIERLRVSKVEVLSLLRDQMIPVETATHAKHQLGCAPLTFSQLAHWHMYGLEDRKSLYQVASVMRLRGPLRVSVLQLSVGEVLQRHDALRTRIVVHDGVPVQEIASISSLHELRVHDLTTLSEDVRETEAVRLIETMLSQPVDLALGPLCVLWLLRLHGNDHMLFVAMDHMISDALSLNILLTEISSCYRQFASGGIYAPLQGVTQFSDYALSQARGLSTWLEKHDAYWRDHFRDCGRVRFPEDRSSDNTGEFEWANVKINVGGDSRAKLLEWARVYKTTLVMSVFTAYVGLVLRWCNVSEVVIQYQTDGRSGIDVQGTIGYFASPLHLRVRSTRLDRFVDLLHNVVAEYCDAYEHADSSYLEAQDARPGFTRNSCFNWIPQTSKTYLAELAGMDEAIISTPVPFSHPMLANRDAEPILALHDYGDDINGFIFFQANRISSAMMEKFRCNLANFISQLINNPEGRVADIGLVR